MEAIPPWVYQAVLLVVITVMGVFWRLGLGKIDKIETRSEEALSRVAETRKAENATTLAAFQSYKDSSTDRIHALELSMRDCIKRDEMKALAKEIRDDVTKEVDRLERVMHEVLGDRRRVP